MSEKMVLIKFYAPPKLKQFLKEFARDNGMEMSELIRHALIYFHMAYLLGELKVPYNELKNRFIREVNKTYKLKR